MSVDALIQVFRDHREVPPGVQAVLVALAWRTPQGRDSTAPTSYADIAGLTRQAKSTVQANVLRGIALGAIELVWARPGDKSRFRVNRGEWFVPGSPADLETALAAVALDFDTEPIAGTDRTDSRLGTEPIAGTDRTDSRYPLRIEGKKEEGDPTLFEVKNADLLTRLREKGEIQ